MTDSKQPIDAKTASLNEVDFSSDSVRDQLNPGDTIAGAYKVQELLGFGGMSIVYRCEELSTGRTVAVKMLLEERANSERAMARFQQEAKAVARLDHPNIVRLYTLVADGTRPAIVMECVNGRTLSDLLKDEGMLSWQRVVALGTQICDALSYAHNTGVIHRDLKPGNIIIENCGQESERVKIVDFGIAKIQDGGGIAATATGEIFGTCSYMSPEQARGGQVDGRADQYSLACILFECLTSAPPFVGSSYLDIMIRHTQESPPTLKEASLGKANCPAFIESTIERMLQKDPSDRFASMNEVRRALLQENLSPESTPPQSLPEKGNRFRFVAIGAAAGLLLAVVCALAFHLTFVALAPTSSHPRAAAPQPEKVAGFDTTSLRDAGDEQTENLHVKTVLVNNPQLTSLDLNPYKHLTDEGLRGLIGAKSLHKLDLTRCREITDRGIVYLSDPPLPLRDLNMTELAKCGDNAAQSLSHVTTLEALNLGETGVTDDGVISLSRLKGLQSMWLQHCKITDRSMPYLARLQKLQVLVLDHTQVTRGFAKLSPVMSWLSLKGTPIDDKSLEEIAKMRNLSSLILSDTKIDDRGLRHLYSLRSLKEVLVGSCPNVTQEGLEALKHAMPVCHVQTPVDDKFEKVDSVSEFFK